MKNIRHLMVASKGQAQPPIRQNNNKIYVTTTNITALLPKLRQNEKATAYILSSPLSLSLSLSPLPLSPSLSL